DPNYLARQFNANYHVKKAEEETSVSNTFRAVLATLGMGFFNLVVVLGPFLALLGTLFGLFVAAGSIIVAGIAIFAASVFGPILPITFDSTLFQFIRPEATLFASIGLICLGLLFLIGDVYLGKLLFSGMVRYLKFNLKIIKGA
ncbi:MAG: DUF1700 domain-containing protein, partial [Firmicutes bacterium]|nr:DUF1700 domain-containing protein [Bacillota bacterium]